MIVENKEDQLQEMGSLEYVGKMIVENKEVKEKINIKKEDGVLCLCEGGESKPKTKVCSSLVHLDGDRLCTIRTLDENKVL